MSKIRRIIRRSGIRIQSKPVVTTDGFNGKSGQIESGIMQSEGSRQCRRPYFSPREEKSRFMQR
jgi:hypothetical protein